jgi:hypothetical protein
MTVLTNLTRKTVAGTFVTSDDGVTPPAGTVTFTPTAVLHDAGVHATVLPVAQSATLTGGSFSVSLLATDDPDVSPAFRWTVTEAITGQPTRSYQIEVLSAATEPIQLADLAPAVPPVTAVSYVLSSTFNAAMVTQTQAIADAVAASQSVTVRVTADGATDAGPAIQAVLDALPTSAHSFDVAVEGTTKGSIFINTAVQIKTSNTRVRFRAPLVFGNLSASNGYLSIVGSQAGSTTVSSGATRGSSQIVVASATGFAAGQLVHLADDDTSGGSAAGDKTEMAEVIDVSGTTIMLDHPLYQDYTGTITLARITDIQNSGFEDANITWSAQQPQGVYFGIVLERVRNCYVRNINARGSVTNSWSREMFRVNLSYRCEISNCSASNAWTYDTASSYSYGFSCHRSTACAFDRIWTSNLRHGFTAEKGSAALSVSQGKFFNVLATGVDFHGNWTRDSIVSGCLATSSETHNSQDFTRHGFLAGNTTFIKGCRNVLFSACTSTGFTAYTPSGGSAGGGSGYGFGVVDGTTNIRFQGCRIVDCQHGVYIKSQVGEPITNVSVVGCEFNNVGAASGSAVPINVSAGVSPNDVLGLVISNNEFTGCNSATAIRIWGNTGNQLLDVVIAGNTWSRSSMQASNYALDLRYIDDCAVIGNRFIKTRRGLVALSCVGLVVSGNKFVKLTDVNNTFADSGGNTNMVMRDNDIIGYVPTARPSVTSTGAAVEFPASTRSGATAARPTATRVSAGWGPWYDTDLGKPIWSDGTVWRDAAGTGV